MSVVDFDVDVTWGAVRLWCSSITTAGGRTQVVHALADGDRHPVQDRGIVPGRPVRCELLFIEMPNEPTSAKERFAAFRKQVNDGERLLFTHPFEGSYYVNAGAFDYTADEDGEITACSIEFIAAADVEAPVPAGTGVSIATGEARIAARAAALSALLDDLEVSSDIPARAIAAQESWADAEIVPTRQVITDVADLSQSLNDLIVDQGLEEDLALWEVYKATIFMGAAIREAALAALAETPKVTAIRIANPVSLLALCVRLYGGAEAEARMRQILALNDIRTPAWIAVGSIITVPVPRATTRLRAA